MKTVERICGIVFLITFVILVRDSRLPPGDPSRWLPDSRLAASLMLLALVGSAGGYLLARRVLPRMRKKAQ